MCRILGYFGKKEFSIDQLKKIAEKQKNGGPDGQYVKLGKNFGLSNNRLAIQGLDGGVQPFTLNKLALVYNGEIYNHNELRNFLKSKGYFFEDNCDGNVILPLYELYGEKFLAHLNGMFALALIDERNETKLILAADPAAVKSLYYHYDHSLNTLYFASELDALLEFPIQRKVRKEAIHEYLIGRSIWHNKTFYHDIYSLGPQEMIISHLNAEPILKKYEINSDKKWGSISKFEESAAYFDSLFEAEIMQMLEADVPACLVTSGGLDSSYVTALAAKNKKNLECFHVAYEGKWPSDEQHFARSVAEFCQVKYNQITIRESEFPFLLEKTIQHLGQPNSAPHSLSTYALFQGIHEAGFKVALTGEGADEFFGGYDRFRTAVFDSSPVWLHKYSDLICATTLDMRDKAYSDEYRSLLKNNQILQNAHNLIHHAESKSNSRLKSLLSFDQIERFPSYILRRVDHLSMANSVEVRVPFCQPNIISYSRSLPDDYLVDAFSVKKIVYESAKDKLPRAVLERKKQPFTLPIVSMLKKGHVLFDILYSTLTSTKFRQRNLFDEEIIKNFLNIQANTPNSNTANYLWSVMILELWLQSRNLNF